MEDDRLEEREAIAQYIASFYSDPVQRSVALTAACAAMAYFRSGWWEAVKEYRNLAAEPTEPKEEK